jgi:phosphonatase-like hydrolase
VPSRPLVGLVVLDVAGTTIQEHGAVYTALLDAVVHAGGSPDQHRLERWMGADKKQAVAALLADDSSGRPADPELVLATYQDFQDRLHTAYRERPPTPVDGVEAALRELRDAGIQVALTTGFTREVATALLDIVGWGEHLLDAMITVDDVTTGRPAPYLVFRAMEATGVHDVRRILVGGDTVRDLQSGNNAGAAFVVGVLTGGHDARTLGATRHTHLLPSAADVPSLVLVPE